MDWEGTSQVPELGFLCQPAIPAAHRRACWQRKFPELSTCNVTLITQREVQKGGYWSRLHSLAGCRSLSVSLSDSLFLFWAGSKSELPKRKQVRKGLSSWFQLPTRLNTSDRICQGWLKWGRLPWQQLCHFATCVFLWEGRRQRLSHHHHDLFSPCWPREFVPLEHPNGLVEVISLNLPDPSSINQEMLSHEVWF